MKTVAFIVARKGSKRIPGKNMKEMCGKPLIWWCMNAALTAKSIDKVYVATDDIMLEQFAGRYTNTFKTREMYDDCIQETIIQDFLTVSDFTDIVLMQATSPLVTAEDIDGAIRKYNLEHFDSITSVVKKKYHSYDRNGYPNFDAPPWPDGDDYLEYIGNGAFWITSRQEFERTGCRMSDDGHMGIYEMPEDTLYEIDTDTDWVVVETLLERRLHG